MQTESLHYSRISSWLKCQKLHHWAYEKQLTPLRRGKDVLFMGTLCHAGMEGFIKGESPEALIQAEYDAYLEQNGQMLNTEELDTLAQMKDDAVKIAERGIAKIGEWSNNHFGSSGGMDDWETVRLKEDGSPLIERRLSIPFPQHPYWRDFQGTADWVARHKPTNTVWVWDFKFRKQLQPEWAEDLDIQMRCYMRMLAEHGVHCDGTIKFQGKQRVPVQPQLTQKGAMSKNKSITTDWDTYRDAVLAAGLDINDYLDMEEKLEGKTFYQITPSYRSPDEVTATWEKIVVPAACEIAETEKERIPSLSFWTCRMCDFRELCIGSLKGEDTEYMIGSSFLKKGEKPTTYILEEDEDEEETNGEAFYDY